MHNSLWSAHAWFKNPDVHPIAIGIGDVPQRILAKAILHYIRQDIVVAAGPLQVYAGQAAGCEAAIYTCHEGNFYDAGSEAALLVDTSNTNF